MDENRIQNQIAIYMTNKKLCEFNDKLRTPPPEHYAHMHAQGEKLPDGRAYSSIGVVLQDYSNGTGDSTIRVTANMSPSIFAFLLAKASAGVENFEFSEEKIFGEPDENGLSSVTRLWVKRASYGQDKKPRNYPWCIIVENGRAVKESSQTGGIHIKSGTYKKTNQVFVNINDRDFFNLMYRTVRYIETWELTFCPKVIREAKQLQETQRNAGRQ